LVVRVRALAGAALSPAPPRPGALAGALL